MLRLTILLLLTIPTSAVAAGPVFSGAVNQVIEWGFTAERSYTDPFGEVELDVVISGPEGAVWRVPAYWAGGSEWRVRFSAPEPGEYSYRTESSDSRDAGLHGRSGTLVVSRYEGDNELLSHGPLRVNVEGRYLEHADGTPFFWLADSWWHGMTDRLSWPEGFQLLAQDRKRKGFTVIQFAVAFPCDIAPFDERGANAAGHAWTAGYDSINPAYFDLADLRVQWLVRNGLVPNIVGAWGYYLPFMGVEKMKRHWRYLVARYGAYPVTWTLAGEVTLPWYLAEDGDAVRQEQRRGWSEVARYLERIDPYDRVMTAHPGPNSGGLEPLVDMEPLDFVMLQTGHNDPRVFATTIDHLREARARYPARPMMIGEACFEGMKGGGCGAKTQRYLFWAAMLSGAAGHSYGADALWQMNTRSAAFGASPLGYVWGNTPWEEAYQWPGASHIAVGKSLLSRYDWWRLEPHPEWVSPAASEEAARAAFAAGIPGELRVFYFPREIVPWGAPTYVRHLEPGRTYEAAFLNPITGEHNPLDPVHVDRPGDAWTVPVVPILQDWVLVLTPRK